MKRRKVYSVPLASFLTEKKKTAKIQHKEQPKSIYVGNLLDSSQPIRNIGKHREIPSKKRLSKLKNDRIHHECENSSNTAEYCDNLITCDLNEATAKFIKKIVGFQQNAFEKDAVKAKIKKRYVVGLHETKKYMLVKKIKILIIAADLKIYDKDELLYINIDELKYLAKENGIHYVFALRRSKLGNLVNKNRPTTCIGVLNYQSAEDELGYVLANLSKVDQNISNGEECVSEEILNKLKELIVK